MKTEEMLEQADYLLRLAMRKCDSWEDAQDLVQATLLEGLLAIKNGVRIDNPGSWLATVLNRRYYDMLREKYRKPLVFYGMDFNEGISNATIMGYSADEDIGSISESGEMTENENIRRLIARMTKSHREVLVRHYFHGQGVKEIAKALSLPENTVKSRLRLSREKLRKDLKMEKYEKQSYEPENLWISSSGNPGLKDQPNSLVRDDKIAMNLLILAYEKPVTIPELADAIGISTTYVEPIVERLVDGELMKRVGDKVFTDFIIYSEKDRISGLELQKDMAKKLCDDIWVHVAEGLTVLREREYYKRQNDSARLKLEGYFVLCSTYDSVLKVRDEVAGHTPFSEYPYRKDGGRWFAMGNRYPSDYDYQGCPYSQYEVSGEAGGYMRDLPEAKMVGLFDYDTDESVLGRSHNVYHFMGGFHEAREYMVKLLYAVYRDDESLLSGIPQRTLENMDIFLRLDFLERMQDGKLKLNVPILSEEEKNAFYGLMKEYACRLQGSFHDEYVKMICNPVMLPKHLQAEVPGFLRYLFTCSNFPTALILEARTRGLFLKDCRKPVPAVLMVVSKE